MEKSNQVRIGAKVLMAMHARATAGLREMGVARSRNPLGEYAEWLVSEVLGLERQGPNKRFDAVGPDGLRYEIKGRMSAGSHKATVLGGFTAGRFDVLVGVFLDAEADVELAFSIPHDDAVRLARETASGRHNIRRNPATLGDPAVTDLTQRFQF